MEAGGRLLGDDEEGEIVIRGWSVGQGYFAASDLNSALFSQGWLHTGDTAKSASFGGVRYFYIGPVSRNISALSFARFPSISQG
jgi:acyl-CoA synthetase (AMP-forming)/AMP-acid ligase II